MILATAAYRRRFAGSLLGYAWMILQPLMLFGVLYLIFTRVVRFGGRVPNYPMVLLLNVSFFVYFREGTRLAMRSFGGRSIMRSIKVPPIVMPLAAILNSTFRFGWYMLVTIVWILLFPITPTATWLLLPVLVLYLIGLVVGLGVLLSCVYVRFPDIGLMWTGLLRILLFSSPILYPFDLIKGDVFRAVAAINPLCPLLTEAHAWITDPAGPSWPQAAGGTLQTVTPFVVYVAIWVGAFVLYMTTRKRVAERI